MEKVKAKNDLSEKIKTALDKAVKKIIAEIDRFAAEAAQFDDITLLALKPNPDAVFSNVMDEDHPASDRLLSN